MALLTRSTGAVITGMLIALGLAALCWLLIRHTA